MTSNESGPRAGSPTRLAPITVLAVGNTIMGDDGVGPAVLAALSAARAEDPRVLLVDGGTLGMSLLPVIQDARRLLVLDAVDVPGDPGDVVLLAGDQLPRLLSAKLSPHQVGLLDILTCARLLGSEPERVAVVGIVPGSVDLALDLSAPVAAALQQAAATASAVIDGWLVEVDHLR